MQIWHLEYIFDFNPILFGESYKYVACNWIKMFSTVESLSEVIAANLAFGIAARRRNKNTFLLLCVWGGPSHHLNCGKMPRFSAV